MAKKYLSMLLGGTLTTIVITVMLMSDSVIAGVFINSDAMAGVTLVTPLYSLAAFFCSVISIGVPTLYTTEMGKFNKERADRVFGFGLLMAIVVGISLFVLTSMFGEMYLRMSSPTEDIMSHARKYLSWMRFTILLLPIQNLICSAVYSDGDETVATIATGVQGAGNIVLSIIVSPGMGTAGIGLASFLFNIVSILILILHFFKKNNSLRLGLYFSFNVMKGVARYGIIDSSAYLFLSVFTAILNAFISAQFGAEYLTLASVITMCREFQVLFDGIGQAAGPIFGVYVGEQNHEGLRTSYSLANISAIAEGIIVTLVLIIIAPFVPQFLNIANPELAEWVVTGVRLIALNSVFISILYLLTSYYLLIDKIAMGVAACALRDVVLNTGLALVLGRIFGLYGMFIGIAVGPAIAYALFMLYLRIRYGKKDCPLLLSKVPGNENTFMFSLNTEPDEIITVQEKAEVIMNEHNLDKKTVGRVMLLIEELYILIRQMNGNKAVLAECTIILRDDGVQIISKDDGVSFDMADEDVSTVSLSAYTIASYLEKKDYGNRHLTTMSFNRSSFLIKFKQT